VKRIPDRDYQKMMNSAAVQRALDVRADAIVDLAARRIKHVTGKTAESVTKVTATRDDGVSVRRVGYDLDQDESGPYYEFGTEDTPPHPTLRAAAAAVQRAH
jgi:HK97 gp10 family phage protein